MRAVLWFCLVLVVLPLTLQNFTQQPHTDLNEPAFTLEPDNSFTELQPLNSTEDFNATELLDHNTRQLGSNSTTAAPAPSSSANTTTIAPIQGCLCDLTPDFCDIGCCCDVVDCGVSDLSSVFSDCRQVARVGVCIESWLVFRANVDPQLVTLTDSQFCVRKTPVQSSPVVTRGPFSISTPHFSLQALSSTSGLGLYKVDSVILTYFKNTSVVSVLRQPSPGAMSTYCVDRNPAKFLRSGSSLCYRVVSTELCKKDTVLSFNSYFNGFSLLKVPLPLQAGSPNSTIIPIIPLTELPEPVVHNGSCLNAITKVEYVITYNGAGEITAATLNVDVTTALFGMKLQQQHTVQFQLEKPSPTQVPSVGYVVGMTVIGWFGKDIGPLTIQGLPADGECSLKTNRAPILFVHNTFTGCTFRSLVRDCTMLRAQLYSILHGTTPPSTVAMTMGTQPSQSSVVLQECPAAAQGEICETGCLLPVALSVRILWARRGLLALPQNHILGVKYAFSCQILKCPVVSPLPLTTEVIFSDATIYPEAPRSKPHPQWKFPFGFLSGGADELDGV